MKGRAPGSVDSLANALEAASHDEIVRFFPWYNAEHRHVALGLMTPANIHDGRAPATWAQRADVVRAAYQAHPERFPRGVPVPPPLPTAAWINKPVAPAAPALAASDGGQS